MAKFLYHEACEACGSKDNKAVYDDGSTWCFGCRTSTGGITNVRKVFQSALTDYPKNKDFPWDATQDIPGPPMSWLLQYGLTTQSCNKYGIYWSPIRQMLCWQVKSPHGETLGWQGRNFSKYAKVRYTSHGRIHEDLCIIGEQKPVNFCDDGTTTVVLVEDYISAIKVSTHLPCIPLFGCTISTEDLQAIKKRFKGVIVWLDSDKLDNARKIALKASMLGLTGQVLFTELDTKCYSTDDIKRYLSPLNSEV